MTQTEKRTCSLCKRLLSPGRFSPKHYWCRDCANKYYRGRRLERKCELCGRAFHKVPTALTTKCRPCARRRWVQGSEKMLEEIRKEGEDV